MKIDTTVKISNRASAFYVASLATLLLLLGPSVQDANAQVALGVQGNWGSEADLGVGARLLTNLGGSNFETVASVDRFFPDNNLNWWDFNANLFYHFHLANTHTVLPYLGGGLNVARLSSGNSANNEAGLNLAGGIRFPGSISPFVEVRAVVSGAEQIVITGGLLFGRTGFH
ncbi:MAG: hypothetical protein WEA09_09870 [Gemmatimonadota bacterium]